MASTHTTPSNLFFQNQAILMAAAQPNDLQLKHEEYEGLLAQAERGITVCREFEISIPRRVTRIYLTATEEEIDYAITSLRSGISLMEQRMQVFVSSLDPYFVCDPDIQYRADSQSDDEEEKLKEFSFEQAVLDRVRTFSLEKIVLQLSSSFTKRKCEVFADEMGPARLWRYHNDNVRKGKNTSAIAVRYYGPDESVSVESFHSLAPGEWVDGDIISLYVRCLTRRYNQINSNQSYFWRYLVLQNVYFPSFLEKEIPGFVVNPTTHVFDEVTLNFFDLIGQPNPGVCKSILIPFNIGGFHWVLGEFSLRSFCCTIYDSSGSTNPSKEQLMIEEILPYLVRAWDEKQPFDNKFSVPSPVRSWSRSYPPVAQQQDGNSCGIFCLAYLDCVLRGEDPTQICFNLSPIEMRECLASDLLKCGVSRNEFYEIEGRISQT